MISLQKETQKQNPPPTSDVFPFDLEESVDYNAETLDVPRKRPFNLKLDLVEAKRMPAVAVTVGDDENLSRTNIAPKPGEFSDPMNLAIEPTSSTWKPTKAVIRTSLVPFQQSHTMSSVVRASLNPLQANKVLPHLQPSVSTVAPLLTPVIRPNIQTAMPLVTTAIRPNIQTTVRPNVPMPNSLPKGSNSLSTLNSNDRPNLVISKVSTLQQSIPPDVQSVDITLPENSNKRLWVCNKCPYTTERSQNFVRHHSTMHAVLSNKIECCDSFYPTRWDLMNHNKEAHPDQVYNCKYSDCQANRPGHVINFGRRALLQRHINAIHRGERPYRCSKCEYTSSYKSNVDRHFLKLHKLEAIGVNKPKTLLPILPKPPGVSLLSNRSLGPKIAIPKLPPKPQPQQMRIPPSSQELNSLLEQTPDFSNSVAAEDILNEEEFPEDMDGDDGEDYDFVAEDLVETELNEVEDNEEEDGISEEIQTVE